VFYWNPKESQNYSPAMVGRSSPCFLPNTDIADALVISESIRNAIRDLAMNTWATRLAWSL